MVSGAASFRSSWSEPRAGSACRVVVASLFREEELASSFEQLGSVGALLLVREASTAIDVAEVQWSSCEMAGVVAEVLSGLPRNESKLTGAKEKAV